MYIRIAFLFLVLGSLLVPSCKKDKNGPGSANDLPLGTLQFKADGQEYSFSGLFGQNIELPDNGNLLKDFAIIALDVTTQDQFDLHVHYANSPPPKAGVAYEISDLDCEMVSNIICPSFIFIQGGTNAYISDIMGGKAYVKFSVLELNGGEATGEFTGTLLENNAGNGVEITEGLFHVKVL